MPGPVLCVRWAHSGKWLASGSDDAVVMIWDLDPWVFSIKHSHENQSKRSLHRYGAGKVWGSDETNIEGWKALKRLPGHESGQSAIGFGNDARSTN